MTDSVLDDSKALAAAPPLVAETPADRAVVDALIDQVFGPGRYAKTAERLREGNVPLLDLSFVCWRGLEPIGCVRQWPILIGGAPAVFLGPFAVEAAQRKHGLGAALIQRACEAAAAAGVEAILLVGDLPYFGPHGFEVVPAGRIRLPGPVDPRRVLWRALKPGGTDGLNGPVTRPI
jgi:predicted N-acetyltransferase YhbS